MKEMLKSIDQDPRYHKLPYLIGEFWWNCVAWSVMGQSSGVSKGGIAQATTSQYAERRTNKMEKRMEERRWIDLNDYCTHSNEIIYF